jgi:hypothetical protein
MIVFDWMRQKLTSHYPLALQQAHKMQCRQCGIIGSKQNLMLEYKHVPHIVILENTCKKERDIAHELLKDHAK